ncbi:MAG: biotin/lipoyl-binding protein, partial [Comamonas sp.]
MNKSLVGLPAAAHLPTKTVAKLSVAAVAVAVAGLLSGCDASKATEGAPKAAAALPKGFLQVKPESVKMLDIAVVTDPQGLQMAWAPAHVAFVEDRVASASVPISARVVTVNAHVGDMVKAGDLLATLVSPDALRTRYDVAAAKTAHDVAVVEAQRQQNMVNKGVGVEVDLRAAQAKLRETTQELGR